MESTDFFYFGLSNGRCVASAWKQEGNGAEKCNAETVSNWVKRGMDVVTLHREEPEAKRLFDQMWDDASERAKLRMKGKINA